MSFNAISLDLTHEQLAALAYAASAARLERHRHQTMDVDDVLEMRRLAVIGDGLSHLAGNGAINTVRLSSAETATLRTALSEWLDELERRGWMRDDDREAIPVVRQVLEACGGFAAALV